MALNNEEEEEIEALALTEKTEEIKFETDKESDTSNSLLPTPPDGGWGWAVVFASFMLQLIVDGIAFSYGVLY